MDDLELLNWVNDVEQNLDSKLVKWEKENPKKMNGIAQFRWTYNQSIIILNLIQEIGNEVVNLHVFGPKAKHEFHWQGFTLQTFNNIMDRVGNIAQIIMTPPIDPTVNG